MLEDNLNRVQPWATEAMQYFHFNPHVNNDVGSNVANHPNNCFLFKFNQAVHDEDSGAMALSSESPLEQWRLANRPSGLSPLTSSRLR
ncbi:hypothetical protein PCANC_09278 [Puccinia coronata f. sp. avenae]|uniref:Uncharacterized protein n=1 Tax=Puccinia coronata f. sp. avenae TaxID=200324 RepID=A0A2N5T5M2_9BASI|nr:hypothetical protein PCANC_09278 [Puccinia coronata f. sp. avenae]